MSDCDCAVCAMTDDDIHITIARLTTELADAREMAEKAEKSKQRAVRARNSARDEIHVSKDITAEKYGDLAERIVKAENALAQARALTEAMRDVGEGDALAGATPCVSCNRRCVKFGLCFFCGTPDASIEPAVQLSQEAEDLADECENHLHNCTHPTMGWAKGMKDALAAYRAVPPAEDAGQRALTELQDEVLGVRDDLRELGGVASLLDGSSRKIVALADRLTQIIGEGK